MKKAYARREKRPPFLLLWGLLVIIILYLPSAANAQMVAVIKGDDIRPYDDALRGFKKTCNTDIREFIVSGKSSSTVIQEIIESKPSLILALGAYPLAQIKEVRNIPIVYAMVSNPRSILHERRNSNITGVSMNVSARHQINTLLEILPNTKRIGLIYNPAVTAELFNAALAAATTSGISIVAREVNAQREVPGAALSMKDSIDALWLLPDTTVLSEASLEHIFLFSFENKIPIFSFSEKYVELGSIAGLSIDAFDIGQQAGEKANSILSGTDVSTITESCPRTTWLSLNLKTAKRLGITVSDEIIRKARKVY